MRLVPHTSEPISRTNNVFYRLMMVGCQGVDVGLQVLMMLVFRYKFALRPEEKPGLEGFLTFLWNKETGEVSVS